MHPLVELVKDKKVFLPCVSPVIIDNNGRKFAVPCGKCKCCLEKKSQIWRTRLKRESEDNKFQLFFTLTYDNLHVPFFRPAQDASLFVLDDSKGFKFEGDDEISYSPKYSVDSSLYDSSVHPITNFDVDRSFGVVSRRDVQNFLKRFRWHLKYLLLKRFKLRFYDKLFSFVRSLGYDDSQPFLVWLDDLDSDLYEDLYLPVYNFYLKEYEKNKKKADQVTRYFICSEYTPTTYRPHYHGIFWFEDEDAYRMAFRAIFKAWKMCDKRNIDVQSVTGNAYDYVAKYVTGNLDLPKILQVKSTRSFFLASKNPAIGYKSFSPERVQEMYNQRNIFESRESFTRKGHENIVSVVPQSVIARYFPKCFRYGSLSDYDKLRIYTRFIKFRRVGGREFIDIDKSLACYEWYKKHTKLYPTRLFDVFGDEYISDDAWFKSSDINAARACLKWCVRFNCHPLQYLNMLDWFYYEYSMFNLRQQYILMSKLSVSRVWPADECYSAVETSFYDNQICFDYVFLASLPWRLEDALNDDSISLTLESFGMCIDMFYNFYGFLDLDFVKSLYEYNQPYFKKYLKGVDDTLLLSNKSKKANCNVLESVI